jgi:hypothetical protein
MFGHADHDEALTMTFTRKELIDALQEISEVSPDVRFGQMIVNFSYFARGPLHSAIWDVEDDELLEAAKDYLAHKRETAATIAKR